MPLKNELLSEPEIIPAVLSPEELHEQERVISAAENIVSTLGIGEQRMEAHGTVYSVSESIRECPAFARQLVAQKETFEELGMDQDMQNAALIKTVEKMAPAESNIVIDAKKK